MKRPEGFDRAPKPRPAPFAPTSPPEPREPPAPSADPTVSDRRPFSDAERSSTSPGTEHRRDSPTITVERTTETPSTLDRDAVHLPTADRSAAEARERARQARRDARRASALRRAVERAEVRRFTRRSRHRRAGWIAAGVVAVVLVGSVTVSVFSPLLSLQTISVVGTSRVDRAAVLTSLDGQIGKPLARIDFDAVKADLSNFPLIESYVTETRPPHTLVIRITEREPIASVKVGSTFELVDPAGVVIETSKTQPKGVPFVDIRSGTVDGKVYRSTAEVLLSLPTVLRATVKSVTASTADDVTLGLTTGETVVWGSADSSTQKAQLLAGLIKDHKARNPTQAVEYDVSAPDNGIIRTK